MFAPIDFLLGDTAPKRQPRVEPEREALRADVESREALPDPWQEAPEVGVEG